MSLARQIFYSRPVNATLRAIVGPIRRNVPKQWRFPVNGVVRITLDDAPPIRLKVNPTSFQGKLFFWDGTQGFEPAVHAAFKSLVSRSNAFLDIGANLGFYSLLARAYNPLIHIMAFEPLPAAHGYLLENIALNRMTGIEAFPLALSDESGSATFHAPFNPKFSHLKAHLGGTGSLDADASQVNQRAVTVPTTRLDDLLASHEGPPVDLIKLDTEGTEHHVLDGARETIRSHRPIMLCEVLKDRIEHELDERLRTLDYVAFGLTDTGLSAIDSLASERLPTNDYLFCPVEKTDSLPAYD